MKRSSIDRLSIKQINNLKKYSDIINFYIARDIFEWEYSEERPDWSTARDKSLGWAGFDFDGKNLYNSCGCRSCGYKYWLKDPSDNLWYCSHAVPSHDPIKIIDKLYSTFWPVGSGGPRIETEIHRDMTWNVTTYLECMTGNPIVSIYDNDFNLAVSKAALISVYSV